MAENVIVAEVVLALHLPYSYTYRVPDKLRNKIRIGQRVVVQLRNRIYSGIVVGLKNAGEEQLSLNNRSRSNNVDMQQSDGAFLHSANDSSVHSLALSHLKYVLDIVDDEPIITTDQIRFFKWVSEYYVAYIGDVLTAAMPASFRLKSETTVSVSPYFSSDISELSNEELKILNLVADKEKIKLEEIKADMEGKDVMRIIHSLIKKDVLITDEELYNRYRPKKETFIALNDVYKNNKDELKALLDGLDRNKRTQPQSEIILKYLGLAQGRGLVKKSELEDAGCNLTTVNTLLRKEIFIKQSVEISRLKHNVKTEEASSICLNDAQQRCFDDIRTYWSDKQAPVSLLHGVTGSGKTEVYIKLIDAIVKQGGQVLYLLPEIAITTQLIGRLEKYFGGRVAVYNSKFSMVERAEIWHRTMTKDLNKRFDIILGSRSSVFLPFTDLQLVIIDEEHDTSYKQTEPIPHYNGRDCALYLAKLFNAKAILGSATPNVETYKLADENKYQLVELKKQYFDLPLPKIELVDMKQAMRDKQMYGIFSERLFDEINLALEDNKQVILFQNRRGYAPHIECNVCGYVPKCPNCDVSLVLHKERRDLECHYCGYRVDALSYCPECHSHSMRFVGTGTEKIEEELQIYFPKARIKRMDLDSTRTKEAYINIINDFAAHKTDILCGTQIVTKGLDFENVSLVGVLGADNMLHYPDFRAYERTFQILTQVSGRAGRKNAEGKVLIQTFEAQNPVMIDVMHRNYEHMYLSQLKERQMMNFPPYCRLIKLTLQHKDRNFIAEKSLEYAANLRKIFGGRLFGPQEPIIARIKNLYAMEIWLKIEKNLSYNSAKLRLREYNEEFSAHRTNAQIRISVDVDPV